MSGLELILPAIASAASAAAGTVGAVSTTFSALAPTIGLLSSVASAVGGFAASSAQAQAMETQSTNALIQGNQQAMNYQRQAIQVMNRTLETTALINARGAAGGIDPFSGSAGALSEYALNKGLDEYAWAQENVQMARLGAQANQAAYKDAASSYRTQGAFALAGGLLGGVQKFGAIGGPTTAAAAPATSFAPSLSWNLKSAWDMDRI
jgi:hypothetical protein